MPEFPLEPDAAQPDEGSASPPPGADPEDRPDAVGTTENSVLRWTLPTCVLAWLVPGTGHLLMGRWGRALLFGPLIGTLFLAGLALDGKVYRPVEGDPLSYLAALGASGVGSLYIVVHALELGEGDVAAPHHEYGNTFTLVAGLLNLLVILDAFDFAVLRARAAPPWAAKPDSP